jgi:hypothetical protein
LQALYDEHKDKGFVVLGVNVSDDKELAMDYLREEGVTFPNILDTSEAAQQVCDQDYSGGRAWEVSELMPWPQWRHELPSIRCVSPLVVRINPNHRVLFVTNRLNAVTMDNEPSLATTA